jgi:hypothetical protein
MPVAEVTGKPGDWGRGGTIPCPVAAPRKGASDCPELLLEREPGPYMAEVDDITDLLNLLYTSYPGFVSCC